MQEEQDGEDMELIDTQDAEEREKSVIDKAKRITTQYMTKYEKARILGTRALQIR